MAPRTAPPGLPALSFFGIADFTDKATWLFCSESVTELLGYEPRELIGTSSLELVHPDEFASVKMMHYLTVRESETVIQDKVAALAYLRMKHKNPLKGYIFCAVTRTVVHDVVVGSISYASEGARTTRNISTASAVEVVTPSAKQFAFRHWGNEGSLNLIERSEMSLGAVVYHADSSSPSRQARPALMPRRTRKELSPLPLEDPSTAAHPPFNRHFSSPGLPTASYDETGVIAFAPLPAQSIRTAFFLDRFSLHSTITYVSNNNLVHVNELGRPFFDFVAKEDEELVRGWIEAVKAWGVNERGQPSDGGFGYGTFTLCPSGRNSREHMNFAASRVRRNSRSAASTSRSGRRASTNSQLSSSHQTIAPVQPSASTSFTNLSGINRADAIFSAHSDGALVIIRHLQAD